MKKGKQKETNDVKIPRPAISASPLRIRRIRQGPTAAGGLPLELDEYDVHLSGTWTNGAISADSVMESVQSNVRRGLATASLRGAPRAIDAPSAKLGCDTSLLF